MSAIYGDSFIFFIDDYFISICYSIFYFCFDYSIVTVISYKAPIIVKEEENIIFFPTCSPRLKECSWINAGNISNIYKKKDRCLVEFYNKETLEFDISYNIMNNQLSKSLLLEKKFKKRGK